VTRCQDRCMQLEFEDSKHLCWVVIFGSTRASRERGDSRSDLWGEDFGFQHDQNDLREEFSMIRSICEKITRGCHVRHPHVRYHVRIHVSCVTEDYKCSLIFMGKQ
jgi:hypothetical protein